MQLSLFPTKQCTVDLRSYDYTIIAFSGGKDSLACLLWAIANNAPNIELWHHDVDGREGSTLMDWPITRAYCQAIAPEHFEAIAQYEERFNCTIQRTQSVRQLAALGTPYPGTADRKLVEQALSTEFNQPVFLEDWELPSGAYGEQNGSV